MSINWVKSPLNKFVTDNRWTNRPTDQLNNRPTDQQEIAWRGLGIPKKHLNNIHQGFFCV